MFSSNAGNREFCIVFREAQGGMDQLVDYRMKTLFSLNEGENLREVYGSIFFLWFDTEKTGIVQSTDKAAGRFPECEVINA